MGAISESIARYEILDTLGEGGMGRVYKARDPILGRLLAVKVLLPGATNADARVRFLQEARAASSLNHPNIVTIYEVGRHEDSDFIAMEYLDGQPLSSVIPPGGLTPEQAVDYAIQICDALAKAHASGILHRDLKPGNIFVTKDGLVKVLDFGLAKLLLTGEETEETRSIALGATPRTQAGILMGTVAYMSPEQAEGRAVDARSDVFSFGSVLYEMVTGQRAFDGSSQVSVLTKVLRDDPPAVAGRLGGVIQRCLKKEPAARYGHFGEVRAALKDPSSSTSGTVAAPDQSSETASIAVLPFLDLSPQKDQEYFCDGIAEEIINSLTRLKNVRVAARTSTFLFKGRTSDIRAIGQQLNVRLVLEGSVRTAADRLRVTTQLIDATEGHQLWSERYDRDMQDVFAVQDEIATAVSDALRSRFDMQPVSGISRRYTDNLEAYTLYLRGRHAWKAWTPEGLTEAIGHFQAAIAIDPSYALAYAGLADAYTVLASFGFLAPHEIYPLARSAARKALEIDEKLAEAHTSLGAVRGFYEWDWKGAEQSCRRAIELNPGYSVAYHSLGIGCLAPQRRFAEAMEAMQKALAVDPFSLSVMQSTAMVAFLAGDLKTSERLEAAMEKLLPGFPGVASIRAYRTFREGRYTETLAALDAFEQVVPGQPSCVAFRGAARAKLGETDAARENLARLDELAAERYVQQYDAASILVALGDFENAFARLERAFAAHDGALMFFASDPKMAPLAGDARYHRLLDRMGLIPTLS